MDILYEQQMLQAIIYIDNYNIKYWYKEVLIVENNTLVDFYGMRSKFKELGRLDDSITFGHCLFLTISYLQDLHRNKKLFHGDIKPMNIFYSIGDSYISSDSGSLVPLYDDQELFSPKVYTQGYASDDFVKKFRDNQKLTKKELLEEDFHQLKATVKQILKRNIKFRESKIFLKVEEAMERAHTVEAVWDELI